MYMSTSRFDFMVHLHFNPLKITNLGVYHYITISHVHTGWGPQVVSWFINRINIQGRAAQG